MSANDVRSQRSPSLVDAADRPSTSSSNPRTHNRTAENHDRREDRSISVDSAGNVSDHVHHRPHLHVHLDSDRLKASFSPSTHELLEKTAKPSETTDRVYDYRVQKWRLWRLSILEWFITLALCAAIFGCLWYYHSAISLLPEQVNFFNAIITGLSIALGLNLNSSLKSYARMMRWRLLMVRYQPLEVFDLIMGCDRLANVIELFFKTWGTHIPYLPSLTGLVCLLWLAINVGTTILVASLGLTYSLDPSSKEVNINYGGLTSVVNLAFISDVGNDNEEINLQAQLIAAQQYGITGQFFTVVEDIDLSHAAGLGAIYQDPDKSGHFRYRFIDENPLNANMAAEALVSGRFIDSWTTCDSFPVLDGGYGNLSYIVYSDSGRNVTEAIGEQGEPGAMVYISQLLHTCGSRCTQVKVFQPVYLSDADGNGKVYHPHFFICNNTITTVQHYIGSTLYDADENVQMPDRVARIVAGVPGWSGSESPNSTEEYQTYSRQAPETYTTDTDANAVENMIAAFSMATVAALDDHGPRKNISGDDPVVANMLDVGGNWRQAGSILAVIPTIHFLAMIVVLFWADKAIILDDTFLSAAKFLEPMIDRLETKGTLMRGRDIVYKLKNPRVKYGWRYIDGNVLHAGIYEESTGVVVGPEFRSGAYD